MRERKNGANRAFGSEGEEIAADYLARHGHKILFRNFRPERGGEIDLISRDRSAGVLVFVEVKARLSEEFGSPAQAVDRKKQRRIARGAAEWLSMLEDPEVPCRFDVVEVIGRRPACKVRHIRDAYWVEDPWRL